jgi:cell division protein FtsA
MSRSDLIVAIDIGTEKIVSLVAQHFPEEERVNIIGVANFPAQGLKRGQIVDIDKATNSLIQSIEAAERMAGYSTSHAYISLSAPYVKSVNSQGVVAVSDPEQEIVPEDVERVIEAARAISLPASQEILHVIPRDFTLDGQGGVVDPVGMSGVRLEVETHIVTASTPALRNLRKCINEAGIVPLDFVYSGFAASEAVLTPTEKELGVVLVDIGGATTTLTIYHEGAPCYSSVLPVGAKNVTNDLAIGLRLSLDEAEKLKKALSKQDLDKDEVSLSELKVSHEDKMVSTKTAIDGIIVPRLKEIFTLVRDEIKDSGFGGSTPAGLVLVGGGANTVKAKASCQATLGLPVRIGEPKRMGGIVDDLLAPEFASSLGLVLYGIKESRAEKSLPYRMFDLSKLTDKLPIKGAVEKFKNILKPLLP